MALLGPGGHSAPPKVDDPDKAPNRGVLPDEGNIRERLATLEQRADGLDDAKASHTELEQLKNWILTRVIAIMVGVVAILGLVIKVLMDKIP